MLNLICRKLADLASIRIQHRCILDATPEFYLLPEDALNDAYDAVRLARQSTTLSPEQRISIERFHAVLDASEPDLSRADFIDFDPDWIRVRNAAELCLKDLYFDLEQYENSQLSKQKT